jgi:Cu-processing system permease protein
MNMDLQTITTIAGHELRIHSRNKWTLIFAPVFAVLALAVSYFGLVTEAVVGFQGFMRTSASLLNLALYLVPMVSLMVGTLSFTGEKGASELLYSQPVARTEVLIGKLLGALVSVVSAILFGFSLSGLVIAIQVGTPGLSRYLAFVGFALLLAAVFLCLGAMMALLSGTRVKSLGYSLFVWFFFVLLYDLLAMGLAFLLKERTANLWIFLSLFGNPVDLARVGSLIALGDQTAFGYAGAALVKFLGGPAASNVLVIGALFVWIAVPTLVASVTLNKRDI